MKARVHVTLKNGVLDPQGKAIGHSLNRLGFPDAFADVHAESPVAGRRGARRKAVALA